MKILDGTELVGYIKERQAKQVRALRQSWRVIPKLAIIKSGANPVVDVYVRLKQVYGDDIGVDVDIIEVSDKSLLDTIVQLNQDEGVFGIIVQLPIENPEMTETAINTVIPEKDVDGLCENSPFTPATAMAIDWLLAGYNVELYEKKIAIVGKGRLVGAPLARIWKSSGYDVTVCDSKTDLVSVLPKMDIIVTATGFPGLITPDMVRHGAVVVDAGTASEYGKIVGDLSGEVRERDDLTITPVKGGVGPLTVTALFDNVISAARKVADEKGQQDL